MSVTVSNPSADRNEKIANAAKVLGRSKDRKKVFSEIYKGKKKIKSVSYLSTNTGLINVRVLQEGEKLSAEDLVKQTKIKGETAYKKIDFYSHNKKQILSLSNNKSKLNTFPTRTNPQVNIKTVKAYFPKNLVNVKQIYIDDIDSFNKIKKIKKSQTNVKMYEADFKNGLKKILGEKGSFKDWGGETEDLFSTKVKINRKRLNIAFALKGKGTSGKLIPKKMGKNGDQIQRLFKSPADIFMVQYGAQIDTSILDQMKNIAMAKSVTEGKKIYYGIIDGSDTSRILQAYSSYFKNIPV